MSEQLKPCPFCNGVVVTDKDVIDKDKRGWYAHCNTLGCEFEPNTKYYDTEAEAIKIWNDSRPIEDELRAKIDELTKERDGYKAKLDFINSERYQEFQKERKEIKERHEKLRKRLDY